MLTERTEDLTCTRLHQPGSKLSDTSMRISLIKEDLSWRFRQTDAKKDNQLLLGKSTMVKIRDG
jgi:hypothetical protein